MVQTIKKWKRKNVDRTKFKEVVDKARPITGNSKAEKMNNIYKVVRWAGSVGYTKGTKNNYRSWRNKEIKQKRKAIKEDNSKRRQLERRKEMGKEQNMREIIKTIKEQISKEKK